MAGPGRVGIIREHYDCAEITQRRYIVFDAKKLECERDIEQKRKYAPNAGQDQDGIPPEVF
jgi:hypothetical protein